MTKEKIKNTIKKLPVIIQELKGARRKEKQRQTQVLIDEDVVLILEIIEDIISYEEIQWIKKWLIKLKTKMTDIRILLDMPISRAEYYLLKNRLIDKIYNCCIYKGLVEYEDILKEKIV